MLRRWLTTIVAIASTALVAAPSHADPEAEKAAIMLRLQHGTAAFNARDSAGVCDLFAPDLAYSIPDMVRGTRETMCTNLAKAFSRPGIRLHYDNPDVHDRRRPWTAGVRSE
jgi:hypothetical protein